MQLKNIFSKLKSKPEAEEVVYLAVEISAESVKSALWTVAAGKTEIIKIGSLEDWDGKNKELLLNAVDQSISNVAEKAKTEPQGVIFGLPEAWVKEDKIKIEQKELLKFICQKLELKPLGFVVTLESLIAYLKLKEGTPPNAVFINVQESQSLISLVRLGKVQGTELVGRSEDLAADVKEGLARFKRVENLPARMVVFNGAASSEEYKQQLASYDWVEALPFFHFPKVEMLTVHESIKAIVIAGGGEVAKSLGFEIKEKKEEEEKDEVTGREEKKEVKTAEEEEGEETTAADLGFVQDQDISQAQVEPEPAPKQESESRYAPEPIIKGEQPHLAPVSFAAKLKAGLKKIFLKLQFALPGGKKRRFVILLLLLLISIGIVSAFYWYVPKARVTIYLIPKTIEKELGVVIDTSVSKIDSGDKVMPGEERKVEIEEEKTINTTGEKVVGDRAAGEVVVYNKTDGAKTFSAGAVLIGPDNLRFTLNEEVSVASKSSEMEEGGEKIVYGKTSVKITAAQIGIESNLGGGSSFSFKDYSSSAYSAKTEDGLSGGTSRQVKVVSQEDRESLLEELEKELKEKGVFELEKGLSEQEEMFSEALIVETLGEKYSAKEEEEADQLTLNLRLEVQTLVYQKSDLRSILVDVLKNEIPEDFVFDPEKSEIKTGDVVKDKEKSEIKVAVKAHLLPKINFGEFKNNLKGRKLEIFEEYFQNLPNFVEANVEIRPNWWGLMKRLPSRSENIIIETEIQE